MSLRSRMGILFLAFLLVVTVSVAATSWMVGDQNSDALVINLAGRQRMLTHQITRDALQIENGEDAESHRQDLREAAQAFDQTLRALIAGGPAPYLPGREVRVPATQQAAILRALHEAQRLWTGFRAHLDVIEAEPPGSVAFTAAVREVERLSPDLARQADDIVRLYEAESTRKLARLRWLQAGFFASALGLLAAGMIMIRNGLVIPLGALTRAVESIGQGRLDAPVTIGGPPELAGVARSLDTMRAQLKTAQGDLELRVQQRTRELTALYDVIREVSSRLDIDHVLRSVTAKARDLLNSDVAFLCMLDDSGQTLTLRAYSGPPDAVCGACVLIQQSVAGEILGQDRAMICRVYGCETVAPMYRASHMAAPLRAGEQVIGALCVGDQRASTYSEDQVRLLTELANSTAIALENARLYQQAERVAGLEERQRIAAEMHDGLAQTLSALQLKVERLADRGELAPAAGELHAVYEAIGQAGSEARRSIANLQADTLPDQTLRARLIALAEEFRQSGGPALELVEPTSMTLPPDDMTQVARVVQEALQNARRHAQARQITIRCERNESNCRLMVADDGRGFDPDAPAANGNGHFGLGIMRARAARIGGELDVQTAPGQGTRVILTWPARCR